MSQVANFAKAIAESTDIKIPAGLPRAAEVVQVKGPLVRVRFTEEPVAGESWFPCTEATNVPVGTWGVVHRLRGNAGYFQPIAWEPATRFQPPPPARGFQSKNEPRTTAGDIDFNGTTGIATVSGLKPSTAYTCRIDIFVWAVTTSTGQFRPKIKYPTGGADHNSQVETLTTSIRGYTWTYVANLTSNASGVISAHSSMQWVVGSMTSSRGEIILEVKGEA